MLTGVDPKLPYDAGKLFSFTPLFFFSPQDKSVAFKIFELGLKKYGDIPEYILAYIDYLSHLNGRQLRFYDKIVIYWR